MTFSDLPCEALLTCAARHGADSADILMVDHTELNTSWRMGKPEGLERSESKALGLRVFVGNRHAVTSTTQGSAYALEPLVERAVAMAKAAPPDPDSGLAAESLYPSAVASLDLCDDAEPDAAWLRGLCQRAEEAALSVPGITNSAGAEAGYSRSRVHLATAKAGRIIFSHGYDVSHFSLSLSVLAGKGTAMERDSDFSSARHRVDLQSPETVGLSAANRALARLGARKTQSCRCPVVYDPRVSRQLLVAFAGAVSGQAVARQASFLKEAMQERVFPPQVRIVDDPHRVRGLGSRPFDAEGVRGGPCTLVENGLLKSWLLDVRSASRLGLTSLGHASRTLSAPPCPASSNLYMENGAMTPEQLMRDIQSGFYVTETFGMGINLTTGDYSQGAAGFWIEGGALAWPVSEITIAGQLREMFAAATPANDLAFRYAVNAPTLRIDAMTVAGV